MAGQRNGEYLTSSNATQKRFINIKLINGINGRLKMPIYCPECQKENNGHNTYCSRCGCLLPKKVKSSKSRGVLGPYVDPFTNYKDPFRRR